MAFAIRPIGDDEVRLLPAIERDAASRFRSVGLDAVAEGDVAHERFIAAVRRHGVALGAEDEGRLVGFALAGTLDDALHLYELSVVTSEGGRGIGGRLLETLDGIARERGHAATTLSTFVDVPWNAPFYARRGFDTVDEPDWPPAFHLLRAAERAAGLPLERRVFMRRETRG